MVYSQSLDMKPRLGLILCGESEAHRHCGGIRPRGRMIFDAQQSYKDEKLFVRQSALAYGSAKSCASPRRWSTGRAEYALTPGPVHRNAQRVPETGCASMLTTRTSQMCGSESASLASLEPYSLRLSLWEGPSEDTGSPLYSSYRRRRQFSSNGSSLRLSLRFAHPGPGSQNSWRYRSQQGCIVKLFGQHKLILSLMTKIICIGRVSWIGQNYSTNQRGTEIEVSRAGMFAAS